MQASPSQLGYLTLSRAVVQALVSPIGGFLGEQGHAHFPLNTAGGKPMRNRRTPALDCSGLQIDSVHSDGLASLLKGTTTTGSGSSHLAASCGAS